MADEAKPDAGRAIVWKKGRKRQRSRARKILSRYFGYFWVRVLHALISRFPFPAGRALCWLLGTASYYLAHRERKIALQSLTRVYGAERSPAEVRALAREVFRHTATTVVDWIILRRWPGEKLLRRFPNVAAAVRDVEAKVRKHGNGGVGITAHCGNWELLSLMCSHFAPGLIVPVAKRLYFQKYNDFLHRLRSETGLDVIYTDESPRKMIRSVKEGHLLCFLPDQDLRTNSGVFVDFFGLPTYTVTFPVDLARKLDANVYFGILVRKGKTFEVIFLGPLEVPRTGDPAADVLAGTQLWSRILEEEIRKCPGQWSWIHPRWRTSPDSPRKQTDHKLRRLKEDNENE
jgi:KDO2-lipid IV(A) lauroyltransferase